MREIRTLRAKWRELETEPRTRLNGHEGGNPGNSQAGVLTGHRASSRPYIAFALVIRRSERRLGTLSQVRAAPNGCSRHLTLQGRIGPSWTVKVFPLSSNECSRAGFLYRR